MVAVRIVFEETRCHKQWEKAPTVVHDHVEDNLADKLFNDPQHGQPISVRNVPNQDTIKRWQQRLGQRLTNLYKADLPLAWRALYTVNSMVPQGDKEIILIEIVDHKEYDRLLGY